MKSQKRKISEPKFKGGTPGLADKDVSKEETVGFHMTRAIITVRGQEPIINAHKTMIGNHIGCLPVLDGRRPIGVITARTLVKCAARKTNLRNEARTVCSPTPTAHTDETIYAAIEKLRRNHARYLLVVNEKGALVGLLSQTDLLEASRRLLILADQRLARAEDKANRDTLTGLYARSVFEDVFEKEFERASRYGGLLALLLLDLDSFKKINDRYGHACGDMVLKRMGSVMLGRVRNVDLPCRYGGDEFAILMPESGTRSAFILGERVRREFGSQKFVCEKESFYATLSGGICKWTPAFGAPGEMLAEADRCMYEAKRKGRDKVIVSS